MKAGSRSCPFSTTSGRSFYTPPRAGATACARTAPLLHLLTRGGAGDMPTAGSPEQEQRQRRAHAPAGSPPPTASPQQLPEGEPRSH